ncbi:DUF2909 domain-containing protein [Photobacterium sanguinicancri]|uniref:DUF2909 domain-containing protein n=1 Tax=Photobacterium sanguinicancri TaxID=875932 RepID=A0AAW7Y6S9_9GAMM|nr:DUF2909 domain-containing protein [Photobacterium sanguinicancri]KXI23960.1 hypothetical protein AS132_03965 [Photobacterium sanguinicancri]MDO6543179.1 DUF2909 domain-containing protein [Photobacterium sanguinicancri]OZS44509.1 DUF2909 domain-containing protein [Photobacterium sanguinicancri]
MLIKALVVCLLVFIIFNLFRALPVMLGKRQGVPLSRYLGHRLWLSVVVFALLLIGIATGLVEPNPRPF